MSNTLHTIGYEGSSIEDFLATMSLVGIDLVVDVRDVPLSRKRGFSKNSLAGHLASSGIGYQHLKALGDPKEGRIAARERRFGDFRRIYGEHLATELAQAAIGAAVSLASTQRACLLCFERDHRECHRLAVAEAMAERAAFQVIHVGVRKGGSTSAIGKAPHGDFAFVG